MSVAQSIARCAVAVVECFSAASRSIASLLDECARKMRRYTGEAEPGQQLQRLVSEQSRLEATEPEPKELPIESYHSAPDADSRCHEHQKQNRLSAPRRFYAVARGIKLGLYQSWFAAANQVLNVPGSMQERFSSRLEALQLITSYMQSNGCTDDIVEYDEYGQEVFRYSQSEVPRRR